MNQKIRNSLKILLSFALSVVFFYFAFREVKLDELVEALKNANYWWVLLLVPIAVISHILRALRWKYILEPIKSNCSVRNLFAAVMIGYAVNNLLPRVGELVRPIVLGQSEKISRTAALGTVITERILDLLSFYLTTCIVLFIYPTALDPFFENPASVRPFLLMGSIVGVAIFLLLYFKAETFFRFIGKAKVILPKRYIPKVELLLESFYSGFKIAKKKNRFGLILFLGLCIQAFYALGMYEPFFAFQEMTKPSLDFGAAVILLVVSSIAWILPAPGALGTYHSFLTVALVKLYNVDVATALSYTLVTHEVNYIIMMILGGYYYLRDHVRFNEVTEQKLTVEKS